MEATELKVKYNPIIFADDDGKIGIQIGVEKVYLTDDINRAVHSNRDKIKIELKEALATIEDLRYQICLAEKDLIRYEIIKNIIIDTPYRYALRGDNE